MASENLKLRAHSRPSVTTDELLYTVTASSEGVYLVRVTNTTSSSAKFRVATTDDGAVPAVADGDFDAYDIVCVPGNVIDVGGLTLEATDRIYVRTDTANSLSFKVYGPEVVD